MNKSKMILFLVAGLLAFGSCANREMKSGAAAMPFKKVLNKSITLHQLEEMFDNMKTNSKWDTTKPMLWGYFFTNNEPKLLEKARNELVKLGYRFVDIHKSEPDESDQNDLWWLHVEKEEVLTPKSLDKINDEMYILADRLGLESYDGMDVGPIK